MAPQLQYLETVITCRGNYYAPDLHNHVSDLKKKLQQLITDGTNNLVLKKVEPWNSVRVTFNMPIEAARRLKELAERRDSILHELGILAVQIEGDRIISLTLESKSRDSASAEVLVSFPAPSATETNSSSHQRLEGYEILERNDQSVTLTSSSATHSGFVNFSTNPVSSLYKEKTEKRPVHVGGVHLPISENAACVSASTPLIHNSPSVNHLMHAQLVAYELQSLQQQFQQPSNFINDISAQTSNGFDKPICTQTRLAVDEGQTVPLSHSVLHATAQSSLSRGWSRVEDRLPMNNNIASSSPLLVNLLKSPGGRHPQPNLLVPRAQNPGFYFPAVVLPQKRRRSQQRTPKRQKIDADGKKPSELAKTSEQHIAVGSSLGNQIGVLSQVKDDESTPIANANSLVSGLKISDCLPTPTTTTCLDSQNKQCFMINPYTGDLEEVNDINELDDVHESEFSQTLKDSCCLDGGLGLGPVNSVTSGFLTSSRTSLSGLDERIHKNTTVRSQSPVLRVVGDDRCGDGRSTKENVSQLSDISSALEVKDIVTSTGDSFNLTNSEATSVIFSVLSSSLSTISKPYVISTTADASLLYCPSSSEASLLASGACHAKSSVFQNVSLLHSDHHQGTVTVSQSRPATSSIFTAVCTNQMTADALPVPGVPSSLSQLNHVAVASSFHEICSMTMHHNTSFVVHPSMSSGAIPPFRPNILASADSISDLNRRIFPDAVALTFSGAESAGEPIMSSCDAAVSVGSVDLLGQPAACSGILSKLTVGSPRCLLQIDKTERIPPVDAVRSSVIDSEVNSVVSVHNERAITFPSDYVTNVATGVYGGPLSSVSDECNFKPETNDGACSQVGNSDTNELKVPMKFPFDSLPQDLLSLSVSFTQNGCIPVTSCLPSLPETAVGFSADDALQTNSSSNCHTTTAAAAAAAAIPIDPCILHKGVKDDCKVDNVRFHLPASVEDQMLPPEKSINSSPMPEILCSKSRDGDHVALASSFPVVETSNAVDYEAAGVCKPTLKESLNIHDHSVPMESTASSDAGLPLSSQSDGEFCAQKSFGDIGLCSVIGKSVLSTDSVFVSASSASESSQISQKNVSNLSSQRSLADAFHQVMKPKTAANPLQSFFHLPMSSSQLTWDTKFIHPVNSLKAESVVDVVDSDSSRSSISYAADSALSQAAFEKLRYLSSMKSIVTIGSMSLNPLCNQSAGAVIMKQDGGLGRTEQSKCPISLSGEVVSSNLTKPIGLQDVIVMQVSSSDLQTSGSSSHLLSSVPFSTTNSEVSEVSEDAVGVDTLKMPPQPVSLLPFGAGPTMRFTVYPETKMFGTRDSSSRKSSRSADDSSPRSKATLTVAKLLEKAESAKMNLLPTNRLMESSVSLENSLRQSAAMSQLPLSETASSTASLQMETTSKMSTASLSAPRTNFGNISVNCLPSKLSLNLPTSLTRSFPLMDLNPLSITAPSYPLNLTESVQKVMQGVGLDTSPPPSPKPSTSNRLSPAKFGGVLTCVGQSRSIPSYGGASSGNVISENKSKDSIETSPAAVISSFITSPTVSIPDCHKTSVGRLSSNGDLAQQKLDSNDSQMNSHEGMPPSGIVVQSEYNDFHSSMAPVLAENRQLDENSCRKSLEMSVDPQPMSAPTFCPVDHSYSALPNPLEKKSFTEKSSEDFHDSIEDLPEHLNSVEDCLDTEEQFYEITETLVNHFDDRDLFVDDLGISNEYVEEVEECVIDPLQDSESLDFVEADYSEESLSADHLQHEKMSLQPSETKSVDELQLVTTKANASVEVTTAENCVTTAAIPELSLIQEDENKLTDKIKEKTENQPSYLEATLSEFPIDGNASNVGENFVVIETETVITRHETTGDCTSAPAASCDNSERPENRKLALQRSRSRKGVRNRERRGGRFVRNDTLDHKLEQSDELEKVATADDNSECNSVVDAVSAESLSSVDSKSSFLTTDSLKQFPSFGCMTTRSKGRRSSRTPCENADLLPSDSLVIANRTGVASRCDLSPVVSKLNDNNQCPGNPIFLRRSMRTLRKGDDSISSGETNNYEHDIKFVATRSRKRPIKNVRSAGSRSARSTERNVMTELTEEYQETVDSSQITCFEEGYKGGLHGHEEPVTSKEIKELPSKKSKT